jgi:hypothetical protein
VGTLQCFSYSSSTGAANTTSFRSHSIETAAAWAPPDLVAVVPRNLTEFGYRWLGDDYGFGIAEFVNRHYEPVGPPRPRDGSHVLLFRRREFERRTGTAG